jgi:hypothetical protein
MIVEKIGKEKITVSFSGTVGRKGLDSIKKYIEIIEANGSPMKKVPQAVINKLSRQINKKVWDRVKMERNLQ